MAVPARALVLAVLLLATGVRAAPPLDVYHLATLVQQNKSAELRRELEGHSPRDINFLARSLLLGSALHGARVGALEALLDWGLSADRSLPVPGSPGLQPMTPLMLAIAGSGDARLVGLLLERGADVNKDMDGSTPLGLALSMRRHAVAALLLEHGARVEPPEDAPVVTPLMELCLSLQPQDGQAVLDLIRRLVAAGARIDRAGPGGSTALSLAALNGHAASVALLLELGADVSQRNRRGESALDLARRKGHVEVVELLQAAGARP